MAPSTNIRMVPVKSSNVRSLGYDDVNNILFVQFKGYVPRRGEARPDSVYKYFNVPVLVYLKFLGAKSKGKFVHWHLGGRYRYLRMGRLGWRGPRQQTQKEQGVELEEKKRKEPVVLKKSTKSATAKAARLSKTASAAKATPTKRTTKRATAAAPKRSGGRRRSTKTRRTSTRTRR